MFRNYFKLALRNLLKNKGFSFINIASLSIGIFGCLVIGLFVWDEKQFDKSIEGGDQVYRIYNERRDNDVITYAACTPPAYASFLKQHYPEVDTAARILMRGDKFLMELGDNKNYEEKGWLVEPSFFKIFPIRFASGDPSKALTDPNSIVISSIIAQRYFGQTNPIGKTLKVDKTDRTVSGVFTALPGHFHLDFHYLMPLASAGLPKDRMERWTWSQFYTYIKLKPGADAGGLQAKLQAHVKKEIYPTLTQAGSTFLPFFQPLKDIHLKSADFIYDNAIRGNETYVSALTIIALFVLAIACFNFINLATARSFRRAKEIGVRKVIGADRRQLIIQFVSETVLLAFISMIIASIAAMIAVPALNSFTAKTISFNPFTNPALAFLIAASGLLIGILAGIYPAFVLSGFQPVTVLKSLKLVPGGSPWLRQALVVVQFALSALLIISTVIVYQQTNYLNNKDLGFNKEQVLFFQLRDKAIQNLETFKTELKRSPNIISITSGYGLPGDQYAGDGIKLPGKNGEKEQRANVFIGDYDYVKTLGLRVIAGRDFSREMATDSTEAFIINETAVKEFGLGTPQQAIGQAINWDEWQPRDSTKPVKKGKVIGVVQDFHYKSLHEKVTASVIHIYPQITFKVAVKMKTTDIKSTIGYISEIWNKFSPGYPLDYKFMDDSYGTMYKSEEKLSELLWIFSVMAIIVGCMGLFGLAAFTAEQRTKEIGIRKVLGADVFNIIGLLSKNFLLLVLIASLIAVPAGWWAMNNWLKDFPYRVSIGWWVFAATTVLALIIAMLTVGFQSIKVATANPVKSLRSE